MYLNSIQLAESFGVSERVIDDWIRNEALPHVADRGRLLFDRARVAQWAAEHGLTARAGFLAEDAAFAPGLELAPMLQSGGIWRGVAAADLTTVLERAIRASRASESARAFLAQRLRTRGGINWAPVGAGFALPHFSTRVSLGPGAGLIVLVLLSDALPLETPHDDGIPVTRLFFFVPPSPRAHLDMLARLSRAVSRGPLGRLVQAGANDEELLAALGAANGRAGADNTTGRSSCQ